MGSGVPRWLAVETLGLRLLQRSAEGRRGPFHGDSLAGGGYSGFPESPAEGGGRTLDLGAFPGTGLILGIPCPSLTGVCIDTVDLEGKWLSGTFSVLNRQVGNGFVAS